MRVRVCMYNRKWAGARGDGWVSVDVWTCGRDFFINACDFFDKRTSLGLVLKRSAAAQTPLSLITPPSFFVCVLVCADAGAAAQQSCVQQPQPFSFGQPTLLWCGARL